MLPAVEPNAIRNAAVVMVPVGCVAIGWNAYVDEQCE